ncbi:MAG: TonB-dependent receptor [Pseudomonadota bacterium]
MRPRSAPLHLAVLVATLATVEVTAQTPTELEEIIIIGEKQGKTLQDTDTSTYVVTPEAIERLNIVDLEDALRRAGNAGLATVGSGRNDQFVLRGVPSGGVTAGTTPVATLIVDNAFVPNQAAGATISNAWDVSQIEILRGAQSTLQGRNSLIGAIVVNTREASFDPDLRARVTYGTANSYELSVAGGGTLIKDQVAGRLSAQRLSSDGFVRREDGRRGDPESGTLLRGKLRIEPTALPNLRWDLAASYLDEDDGSVLVDAEDPDRRLQSFDIPTRTNRDIRTFSSYLTYELNDQWNFTSVTSYAELETKEIADFDGQPDQGAPASPIRIDDRDQSDWLQEFRLNYSNGNNLSFLLGGLYAERANDDVTQTEQTFPIPPIDIAIFGLNNVYEGATAAATGGLVSIGVPADAPRVLTDPLLLGPTLALRSDFNFGPEFDTFAVFGEVNYALSSKFTVTAGFRYEEEDALYRGFQFNQPIEPSDVAALTPAGNPGLGPAVQTSLTQALQPQLGAGAGAAAADATQNILPAYSGIVSQVVIIANGGNENTLIPIDLDEKQSFDVFLPKLVLRYQLTDDVSLAASVQRAYRPGGIGINPVRVQTFVFDQELSWNYEVSLRALFAGGKGLFNANVFFIDWEDQQIEIQLSDTPQDTATENVGASELYGMEAQLQYQLSERLELFASIGLNNTEITEADEANAALVGDEFPFAPGYSGSVGLFYDHPSGLSASFDLNFQGESEPLLPNNSGSDPEFGSGLKNDSWLIANARIAYDTENYSAFVFGSNLFDRTYLVNADALAGNAVVGEPRVIGVGFQLEF